MTDGFSNNLYALEYEHLLVCLHDAMARGDEAEADRLREDMDRPARELSALELARLNGLSADLYMLQGDEVYEDTDLSPEQLRSAITDAHTQGDDPALLASLRQGDAGFTQAQIAFLRANAYGRLGHLLPSLRFMQYAARLDNQNIVYRCLALDKLYELRQIDETLGEARALASRADVSPDKRIIIAVLMYQCTQFLPPEEVRLVLGQARRILEDVLQQQQLPAGISQTNAAYGFAALGLCFEGLGRRSKAMQAYAKALTYNPSDDVALVRRGFLRQQDDPAAAAADFERAVALGTDSALPYLFLARRALLMGEEAKALDLCQMLVSWAESPQVLAAAWEFTAIARSRLGATATVVGEAFQWAIQWDPTNERILENSRIFQRAVQENLEYSQTVQSLFHPEEIPLPASSRQVIRRPHLALAA